MTPVKEWLVALRCGGYKQINGYMHTTQGYCVLGVLSDVFVKHNSEHVWEIGDYGIYELDNHSIFPGVDVFDWAKIEPYTAKQLSAMNDAGMSFAELADEIERRYNAAGYGPLR